MAIQTRSGRCGPMPTQTWFNQHWINIHHPPVYISKAPYPTHTHTQNDEFQYSISSMTRANIWTDDSSDAIFTCFDSMTTKIFAWWAHVSSFIICASAFQVSWWVCDSFSVLPTIHENPSNAQRFFRQLWDDLAIKRFVASSLFQKTFCRPVPGLSTGVYLNKIGLKTNELSWVKERHFFRCPPFYRRTIDHIRHTFDTI